MPSSSRLSIAVKPKALSAFAVDPTIPKTAIPQVDAYLLPRSLVVTNWPEETSYVGELDFSTTSTMSNIP